MKVSLLTRVWATAALALLLFMRMDTILSSAYGFTPGREMVWADAALAWIVVTGLLTVIWSASPDNASIGPLVNKSPSTNRAPATVKIVGAGGMDATMPNATMPTCDDRKGS